MNTVSLKKRYLAKLTTNLVGLVISLITMAIIPRGLGPKNYGDFNFLTNFFDQLLPFFTFSTSVPFFTKLSQRQNEFGLISFYSRVFGVSIILTLLFVITSHLFGLVNKIWFDHTINFIYMAAIYSSLMWLINTLLQISDAYGITIVTEIANIIQKIFGLMLILVLFFYNRLNLINYFFYQYFISILLIVTLILIIFRSGNPIHKHWTISKLQLKNYLKEFYSYSQPLFLYSIVGVIVGIFDRWILQKYAGSVEQGFFSISLKVGALCFLFSSSMTSLITREFSIAHSKNDIIEMSRLFKRFIPLLFNIAAFFSCFISIQAKKVLFIFGGSEYKGAIIPMMIMALYPMHQTYGQLSGSIFYATSQTKLYSKIGLTFMVIGLPIVYFTVAPQNLYGLNTGATGLAIKFVLVQFVAVNVQLFFNTKLLSLSFSKFFAHQLLSIIIFALLALASKVLIDFLNYQFGSIINQFLLSGMLYTFFVALFVLIFPSFFGLSKNDIKHTWDKIIKYVTN